MLFYRFIGFFGWRHGREWRGILIVFNSIVIVVGIHDVFDAVLVGVLTGGDDIGRLRGWRFGIDGVWIGGIGDGIVIVVRIHLVRDAIVIAVARSRSGMYCRDRVMRGQGSGPTG